MHIAAIGDSIAHGACIPSDGHFMGLIQHAEPSTLNLAITGMGPISELAVLKEYAQAARPKILLWMYSEATDVTDQRAGTRFGCGTQRSLDVLAVARGHAKARDIHQYRIAHTPDGIGKRGRHT